MGQCLDLLCCKTNKFQFNKLLKLHKQYFDIRPTKSRAGQARHNTRRARHGMPQKDAVISSNNMDRAVFAGGEGVRPPCLKCLTSLLIFINRFSGVDF